MGMVLQIGVAAFAIAEIVVLIEVGGVIGAGPTVLLLVIAFIGGMGLIRRRGLAAVQRVRDAVHRGETPVYELFDTACVIVAGILFAVPGFLSDLVALVLLAPPIRRALFVRIARRHDARRQPGVIEGEYQEIRGTEERIRSPWDKRP
jgi:UPF0716 protein FxsA